MSLMNDRSGTRWQLRRITVAAAAAATIAVTGCAATQPIAVRDDAAITQDVRARLGTDPVARESKIGVDTKAGIVSLSGAVATEKERSSAEKIARETPGVRSVDNNVRFGDVRN
jgi:osmotically-inducible protein OsmY